VSEEANEQAQQAEATPTKVPPAVPKFEPDPDLIEESLRHDLSSRPRLRMNQERRSKEK
jgi:hypothetical protein